MRPPLHKKFSDKSIDALLAAIEIYNKPNFVYREEVFAILAVNAWELLIKAKLLKGAGNDPSIIRVYESRNTKSGGKSKKQYLKRNRTGTPQTVSLFAALAKLSGGERIPSEIKANLDALVAIRDNATHYINLSDLTRIRVFEICGACVKNFISACKDWLGIELSSRVSLMLPVGFLDASESFEGVVTSNEEKGLLELINALSGEGTSSQSSYAVGLRIHVRVEKTKSENAPKLHLSNDPTATKIYLTEEDIKEKWPWNYAKLTAMLRVRYDDFKQNQKFHDLMRVLSTDSALVHSRLLDPGNPKSGRKAFYSQEILPKIDAYYRRKTS